MRNVITNSRECCPRGGTDGAAPCRSERSFLDFHPKHTKGIHHETHLSVTSTGQWYFHGGRAGIITHHNEQSCLRPGNGVPLPTGYYNPYGQGPYGGYSQGYAASYRANNNMFRSHGGMFGSRAYGYSDYGNVPSGYGNRFDYGIGPHIRPMADRAISSRPTAPFTCLSGSGITERGTV